MKQRSVKRRRSHYDSPHDVYVLADPRTGEIRYVGRTVHRVEYRLQGHLKEARRLSYPIHRWIRRLQSRGLLPVAVVIARGVHQYYETELCEALVSKGVHLLNVTPCYARACGRIVVDVEQEGRSYVGDVVHFDVPLTAKLSHFDFVEPAAAKVFRRMADALDPPKGSRPPSQYESEIAYFMANRLVHVVVEGKPQRRRLLFSPGYSPLGAAAMLAIRLAKNAVRKNRP